MVAPGWWLTSLNLPACAVASGPSWRHISRQREQTPGEYARLSVVMLQTLGYTKYAPNRKPGLSALGWFIFGSLNCGQLFDIRGEGIKKGNKHNFKTHKCQHGWPQLFWAALNPNHISWQRWVSITYDMIRRSDYWTCHSWQFQPCVPSPSLYEQSRATI